jgi:hypothetical protein
MADDRPEREKLARDEPGLDVPMLMLWIEVQELVLRRLIVDESAGADHPGTFAELDRSRTRLHWPWN